MPSKIWNKYKMIKEINSNSNIKTYLTRIEPIIKEIIPKNKNEYYLIIERLIKLKEELHIYEIIEENERIYLVIDNNSELLSKIDKLILSNELNIMKEGIIQGHGNPITKEEILNLFKMEKSMCKISFETLKGNIGKGTGFFCEIDINFPIKYALFTNNHILNEFNIQKGNTIYFEYLPHSSNIPIKKEIKINQNRKAFTNKEFDYTCVELFKSDGIADYFKIEPKLFKFDKNIFKDNNIFILQFPIGGDLSFSYGKILSFRNNQIIHSASTENGASGSPIIRKCKENYIIGLHFGGLKNNKSEYEFNLATSFDSILDNIQKQYNEINNKNENKINLNKSQNLNVESKLNKTLNHCLGLENLGALPYINATIQCLCHVLNFKNYFQNNQLVYQDTFNRNCKLTLEFYKLLNNLWKEPTKNKSYYTPVEFINYINGINLSFSGVEEKDLKNLIIYIYNTIHYEINKINNYNINNNYNLPRELALFRNQYYSKNSSFMIDTFYFEHQSDIKCLYCNSKHISYNINNIIIFNLEKVREYNTRKKLEGFFSITLDDCFENYKEYEFLNGQNQIFCSNCKSRSNAIRTNKMLTYPEVMTIALIREGNNVNFEYPFKMNLEKYVENKSKENYEYKLIGILSGLEQGQNGIPGHFIALCKSPIDNQWYCYNDKDVSKCSDPRYQVYEEKELIPYVLFYQKVKDKPKI